MLRFNHEDFINELNSDLDASSSRRTIIKRLAALGVAAAGGAALVPLAAEAKPKKGGNKGRHGGGARGHNRRTDARSAQLELPGLPHPAIIGLLHIPNVLTTDVLVTVTGNIAFNDEHVALMQRGREFRLTCAVKEEDWPDSDDDLCFEYRNPDGTRVARIYKASSGAIGFFKFEARVAKSTLNKDGDGVDEVFGQLRLWTRVRAGLDWNHVGYYRTLNRIDRSF